VQLLPSVKFDDHKNLEKLISSAAKRLKKVC
jgi:hypothetical protein